MVSYIFYKANTFFFLWNPFVFSSTFFLLSLSNELFSQMRGIFSNDFQLLTVLFISFKTSQTVYIFYLNAETFWLTSWQASFWCSRCTWEGIISLTVSLDLIQNLSKPLKRFLKIVSFLISLQLHENSNFAYILHILCLNVHECCPPIF